MADANSMTRSEAIAALTKSGERYELQEFEINGVPVRVFKNAPTSLRALYEETRSDEPFIVYDDERLTFADAYRDSARIANVLVHQYGVAKGDRVAISMRNYPEWILAFAAATSVGAIAVAMNSMWQPEEMEYGLADCGAKLLFADQERLDMLPQFEKSLGVRAIAVRPTKANDGAADLTQLLDDVGDVDMPPADLTPEDDAMIVYTSGSTGQPKGVVSSHRNVLSALLSWELDARAGMLMTGVTPVAPRERPATLLAVPLFHATGSHAVYLSSYRAQRKTVLMYKWDPEQAAELVEREQITSFIAPAAMTGDLIREAKRTKRDLSTLLAVGGGGAHREPEQVKEIDASFKKALPNTGWGMTETNAIGTGIGGRDYLERPGSSGRVSAVLELRVVDENGTELPPGERGELLVRGTSMFRGYWDRPEINSELFDDGWFRTGDVAYLDDEGYLFIVDRIKDLIIRGGENIGCGQVEAALLLHPDVHEAAVYAVPDDRLGEEVGATVYGSETLDTEALRKSLHEHLARFAVPRYFRLSAEPLPRTASGKIFKRQLREEAIAAMAADAEQVSV
ncbi:MAG: acyl--CoA ligase [Chloroflexi bacterium]|nr:acyl--CoA ligase [Chloroflexota bacterium]